MRIETDHEQPAVAWATVAWVTCGFNGCEAQARVVIPQDETGKLALCTSDPKHYSRIDPVLRQ